MAKRVAKFEIKSTKFQKKYSFVSLYKSKLLNINGLKIRKIKKSIMVVPSGVLKSLDNRLIFKAFCFLNINIYVNTAHNFYDKKILVHLEQL